MRSKDRLAELRQLASGAGAAAGECRDTAAVGDDQPRPDPDIDGIFQEVERIRGWTRALEDGARLMRRLLADPTYHANKQLQDQLDAAATQCNALGLKLCGALRQFAARAERAGSSNSAAARIARLQLAASRRAAADALARLHALLDAARHDQLGLLHRQIKLANLTISDEECQSLLDTRNISLFVDNVQAETAEARRQLRDLEARRDELARVEAALADLRDLFATLALLVAGQQEQIDSVEYYALQAGEHVDSGGRQLLKGSVGRARGRQKKVSLIICLLVGFGIVLLVLVLT